MAQKRAQNGAQNDLQKWTKTDPKRAQTLPKWSQNLSFSWVFEIADLAGFEKLLEKIIQRAASGIIIFRTFIIVSSTNPKTRSIPSSSCFPSAVSITRVRKGESGENIF